MSWRAHGWRLGVSSLSLGPWALSVTAPAYPRFPVQYYYFATRLTHRPRVTHALSSPKIRRLTARVTEIRQCSSVADLLLALCWRRADGCVGHTSVHGLIVTPVLGGLECVRVRSVCARVVLNSSSSTHCGTTSCCAGGHGSTQAAAEAVPANGCPGRVARLTDAPHEERSLIGF